MIPFENKTKQANSLVHYTVMNDEKNAVLSPNADN